MILLLSSLVTAQQPPPPEDPCAAGDPAGCEARCLQGDARACSTAGYLFEVGQGVDEDADRARQLYLAGCNGGDGRGCGNLGVMFDLGAGVTRDVSQALVMYRRGCRAGDGTSCLYLGIHQATGDGLGADAAGASRSYQLGCEYGSWAACNLLGAEREAAAPIEAVELYGKACEGGHGVACYNLARMVVAGHAALPVEDVVKLYGVGCEAGEQAACVDLGVHLLTGHGIARDELRAAKVFQDACESDQPKGCSLRGAMYLNDGEDAPGFALLELGCDRGDAWGCKVLEEQRGATTREP